MRMDSTEPSHIPTIGRDGSPYLQVLLFQRSSNTYSCCASRAINVRFAPEPTTNSEPIMPGTIVTNEIVPSGFLRLATSLFHSPKSKIVEEPDVLTAISPSAALT